MTNTIQFWMDVILHNILLNKIDEQYNPILNYELCKKYPPNMDVKYNPILDGCYAISFQK